MDKTIKIGTLVEGNKALEWIPKLIPYGFESFSITFWQSTGSVDLKELAKRIREITDPAGVEISCVSVFGNPLTGEGENRDTLKSWERLIDAAEDFGTDLVTGFTGRIVDEPIEASLEKYKEVFSELARRSEARGGRIAFENCDMGGTWEKGDWNIAHNPTAWEMMFETLDRENIGLQWEPCHQMVSLIDPIPQLRKWVKTGKIFHVHGKDATIAWDVIREYGIHGPKPFVWHRTPGFGDSNWTDIISILRAGGYKGNIDIE